MLRPSLTNGFGFGTNDVEDRVRVDPGKQKLAYDRGRRLQLIGIGVVPQPQRRSPDIRNQPRNHVIGSGVRRLERHHLAPVICHVQIFPDLDLRHVEGLADMRAKQDGDNRLCQRLSVVASG